MLEINKKYSLNDFIRLYKEKKFYCAYILWDGDDAVYVGSTKHPSSRVRSHIPTSKVFDSVSITVCCFEDMLDVESALIVKMSPKYNSVLPSSKDYLPLTKLREDAQNLASKLISDVPYSFIGNTQKKYVKRSYCDAALRAMRDAVEDCIQDLICDE